MASLCLSSPNPFSSYSLASSPTGKKKHYTMVSCHTSDSSQLRESAAATKPSRSHRVVLSSCAEKKTLIPTASSTLDSDQGIGIVRFLRGKRLLVTGATGFLGKAYANGRRQGRILEKPFCIGDTIANEKIFFSAGSSVKPMPRLDIETEVKLAFASGQTDQELKDLGLSRAWMHGWQDTYSLTKAMGEMVINCMSGDFPVVVVRPSIIGSISREPSPGWIQGNRMLDPIILSYGKGQLTCFPYDANEVADCIPVDMVANAMLAAMSKHGQKMDNGIHVYHTCSSTVNPLTFRDMMRFFFEYFATSPWIDSEGKAIPVSEMKEFSDLDEFSSYIQTEAKVPSNSAWNESSQRKILTKFIKQVQNLARIYEPYTFCRGRFDNTNTQALIEEMSEEEKLNFNFDVRSISWEDYFKNVHIVGLRKHVMKGRGM